MRQTVLIALAITIAIPLALYFYSSSVENAERQKAETGRRERIMQERQTAIAQLVSQANAVDNWEEGLTGGQHYRLEPILTVELERLWMTGRPILFRGTIDDVKTYDQKQYTVVFSYREWRYTFSTNFRLDLRCNRNEIDAFLGATPGLFTNGGLNNQVAVIADVTAIRNERTTDGDDGTSQTKVGEGTCTKISYIGFH